MNATKSDRYVLWVLASLAVWATVLLSCRVTPSPDPTPFPEPTMTVDTSPVAPSPSASPLIDVSPLKAGKLSPRLQLLADPNLGQQSAEAQAQALGLPTSGPGSLMRDEEGAVMVYIRVASATESDVASLASAGANVVHTAEDALTVTAYIHPDMLNGLAQLEIVLNVREALKPQ